MIEEKKSVVFSVSMGVGCYRHICVSASRTLEDFADIILSNYFFSFKFYERFRKSETSDKKEGAKCSFRLYQKEIIDHWKMKCGVTISALNFLCVISLKQSITNSLKCCQKN